MKNKENKNKYKSQIKHLRSNYKSFHIDFKVEIFNKFNELCISNDTTPTTEIKKFVNEYINSNLKN